MSEDQETNPECPKTKRPFKNGMKRPKNISPSQDGIEPDDLRLILPATCFELGYEKPLLSKPTDDLDTFFANDLNIERLSKIFAWLKYAGQNWQIRPLCKQKEYARSIVVTEQADMHLLWEGSKMYLKPLPQYLLDAECWSQQFVCAEGSECRGSADLNNPRACKERLYSSALGLLYSYIRLIQHESDFQIAIETKLVPRDLTWPIWLGITNQVLTDLPDILAQVHERYQYGELRLSRINKIVHWWPFPPGGWSPARGYYFPYTEYSQRFSHNLQFLFTAFTYAATLLAAMQVGLSIDELKSNTVFVFAAKWIMISVLAAISIAFFRIFGIAFMLVFINGRFARKLHRKSKKALDEMKKVN